LEANKKGENEEKKNQLIVYYVGPKHFKDKKIIFSEDLIVIEFQFFFPRIYF